MHRGILNKKSLNPFRPVSARKARGPGSSGPARPGPRAGPGLTISSRNVINLFIVARVRLYVLTALVFSESLKLKATIVICKYDSGVIDCIENAYDVSRGSRLVWVCNVGN